MSRAWLSSILLGALALSAGACNAFDPDLGDTPFLCEPPGSGDKRCPDGYEPVDVGAPAVCECRKGGGGDTPDAGGQTGCNDDSQYEPNETLQAATATAIGAGAMTQVFDNMAICPSSDVDTFRMSIPTAQSMIDVRVSFNPMVGVLGMAILNQSGQVVPNGMGTMQGNQLRATPTVATGGIYYVQVTSTSGQNNYSMQIIVTSP
jgi:hypothetical protein